MVEKDKKQMPRCDVVLLFCDLKKRDKMQTEF